MAKSTPEQIEQLRQTMLQRLDVLRAEINTSERERQADPWVASQDVTDLKEVAQRLQQSDLVGAQERRDLDETEQIEAALQRFEEGRYGECVDCGEAIALQRLQVQPAAPRCAACQTLYERHAGQAPGRKRP